MHVLNVDIHVFIIKLVQMLLSICIKTLQCNKINVIKWRIFFNDDVVSVGNAMTVTHGSNMDAN